MLTVLSKFALVALLVLMTAPAFAGEHSGRKDYVAGALGILEFELAQSNEESGYEEEGNFGDEIAIRPREAARIAKRMLPGSRVLKVKLLPSGIYAVTLRGNGELTRVMVDGRSGDIL